MKKVLIIGMAVLLLFSGSIFVNASTIKKQAKSKTEYTQEFEAALTAKGMTIEEYKALKVEKFAAVAELKGMTVEEYKSVLAESKKSEKHEMTKEEFEAALAAKGMTIAEYKALVAEKLASVAESKGMTVEEYKGLLKKNK